MEYKLKIHGLLQNCKMHSEVKLITSHCRQILNTLFLLFQFIKGIEVDHILEENFELCIQAGYFSKTSLSII